jgi:hypothetical protein
LTPCSDAWKASGPPWYTYEVFRLLDTWLRQVFVPDLPANVRVLFFGRQRPLVAWHATAGWGWLLKSVPVKPLSAGEAEKLLGALGVQPESTSGIVNATYGHPLALKLAAAVMLQWWRRLPQAFSVVRGSDGEAQAAMWLDLKRTYMKLRPALRRVYLTARNLAGEACRQ